MFPAGDFKRNFYVRIKRWGVQPVEIILNQEFHFVNPGRQRLFFLEQIGYPPVGVGYAFGYFSPAIVLLLIQKNADPLSGLAVGRIQNVRRYRAHADNNFSKRSLVILFCSFAAILISSSGLLSKRD